MGLVQRTKGVLLPAGSAKWRCLWIAFYLYPPTACRVASSTDNGTNKTNTALKLRFFNEQRCNTTRKAHQRPSRPTAFLPPMPRTRPTNEHASLAFIHLVNEQRLDLSSCAQSHGDMKTNNGNKKRAKALPKQSPKKKDPDPKAKP